MLHSKSFRTFGVDIATVAKEFNMFCEGKHPLTPSYESHRMDGTSGSPDFRLNVPTYTGRILRVDETLQGFYFAHIGEENTVQVATGVSGFINTLSHWLYDDDINCIAIQDDYPYWNSKDESCTSGKLMLVDSTGEAKSFDPKSTNALIQIFFDDNIERDRAHIVDVRDMLTFAPVPFEQSKELFLHKVEPYHMIRDEFYFIREVDRILQLYIDRS